jgi:hypothetical protein
MYIRTLTDCAANFNTFLVVGQFDAKRFGVPGAARDEHRRGESSMPQMLRTGASAALLPQAPELILRDHFTKRCSPFESRAMVRIRPTVE